MDATIQNKMLWYFSSPFSISKRGFCLFLALQRKSEPYKVFLIYLKFLACQLLINSNLMINETLFKKLCSLRFLQWTKKWLRKVSTLNRGQVQTRSTSNRNEGKNKTNLLGEIANLNIREKLGQIGREILKWLSLCRLYKLVCNRS